MSSIAYRRHSDEPVISLVTVVLTVTMAVLTSSGAAAQPTSRSDLERAVDSEAKVEVHADADSSSPVRGRLVSVTDELVLTDSGGLTHSIPLSRVDRVDRLGDSPADGAVIGAAVLGGLCIWTCRQGSESTAHHKRLVVGNLVIGALLGGLFDHSREGRSTIYRRAQRASIGFGRSAASFSIVLEF